MAIDGLSKNLMEVKPHGTRQFPFAAYEEIFLDGSRNFFKAHWHTEYEIDYVVEGEIRVCVDHQTFVLHKGEAIFINSNQIHSLKTDEKQAKIYAFVFSPKLFFSSEESVFSKYLERLVLPTYRLTGPLDFDLLYHTFKNAKANYEWQILACLVPLFLEIFEGHPYIPVNQEPNKDIVLVKKIMIYLEEHFQDKITLSKVSKEVGVCKTEICRIFKEQTTFTIMDFLNEVRIEKSLYLLKQGEMTITEIAQSVGFNASSYYAQVFKKMIGVSPKTYLFKQKNI